jgi:hypothetical protein
VKIYGGSKRHHPGNGDPGRGPPPNSWHTPVIVELSAEEAAPILARDGMTRRQSSVYRKAQQLNG